MVSSFYSSNENKLKKFVEDRRIKEENEDVQQEIVDEQIAKELGLEAKATRIGDLSKRIARKLGTVDTNIINTTDILGTAINNGKLTELFDKLKMLPDSSLNATQKIIKKDLSNPEFKNVMNTLIDEALPNGVDAIKEAVITTLGGTENQKEVLDMFNKIKRPELIKNVPKERIIEKEKEKDILKNAINNGKLEELILNVSQLENKVRINNIQREIIKRLNNREIKKTLNERLLMAYEDNNIKDIPKIITKGITNNKKEEEEFNNLLELSNKFSPLDSPKSVATEATEATSIKGLSNAGRPPILTKDTAPRIYKETILEIQNKKIELENYDKKTNPKTERQIKGQIRYLENKLKNIKEKYNLKD